MVGFSASSDAARARELGGRLYEEGAESGNVMGREGKGGEGNGRE